MLLNNWKPGLLWEHRAGPRVCAVKPQLCVCELQSLHEGLLLQPGTVQVWRFYLCSAWRKAFWGCKGLLY